MKAGDGSGALISTVLSEKLKQLVSKYGSVILTKPEELAKNLNVEKDLLRKQQLLLICVELEKGDIAILTSEDSIGKTNIMRRCVINTGLTANIVNDIFYIMIYALGCDDYISKAKWFCGTNVNPDNPSTVIINNQKSVLETLSYAEQLKDKDVQKSESIYKALAKSGVPQAKYEVGVQTLNNSDASEEARKDAIELLKEAESDGCEAASLYLGDYYINRCLFDDAAMSYKKCIGGSFTGDTVKKIRFLEYVKRECFKSILLSVIAAVIGLIAVILGMMFCESSTTGVIGGIVLETISLAVCAILCIYQRVFPHFDPSLPCMIQLVIWTFAMMCIL